MNITSSQKKYEWILCENRYGSLIGVGQIMSNKIKNLK
ncbi:DUF6756 family protein [Acaryochloris sp. 'Moss Beach']